MKNKPFTIKSGYIVPAPVLNRFNGSFEPVNHRDEAYTIPDEWMQANCSRYHFTDRQIIDAALPEFDSSTSHRHSRCLGIYFLILDKRIVYVGLSTDMERRIGQHIDKGMPFDSITWFEAPELYLRAIESYYIERIEPRLNTDRPICRQFRNLVRSLEVSHVFPLDP